MPQRTRNWTCLLLLIGFKEYGTYAHQVQTAECLYNYPNSFYELISMAETVWHNRKERKCQRTYRDACRSNFASTKILIALWMRDSRLIAKNVSILHQLLIYFILLLRFDKRRSIRAVQIYLMYDTPFTFLATATKLYGLWWSMLVESKVNNKSPVRAIWSSSGQSHPPASPLP
jgi:hypothetical protein